MYQTQWSIAKNAWQCTCPSRKSPCKHILALMLLHDKQDEVIRTTDFFPRDIEHWVENWKSPEEKAAIKAENASKSRAKRLEEMATGIAELEIWLTDIIREGLASLDNRDETYWNAVSAKMFDAKLSSIGRRMRSFPFLNGHEQLLLELGDIYLLAQGFKQLNELPAPLQKQILTTAGLNIQKKEVLAQREGIVDNWLAIGQMQKIEDNLRVRKTWFLGEQTQRKGMVLEYVPTHLDFETNWSVGAVYSGEVLFYPSAYPLRILFRHFEVSNAPFSRFQGYIHFEHFLQHYAKATAANPWLRTFPCLLEDVIPVWEKEQLVLVDKEKKQLLAESRNENHWKLLALSGGHPICVFGEWGKDSFTPLSALAHNRLIIL